MSSVVGVSPGMSLNNNSRLAVSGQSRKMKGSQRRPGQTAGLNPPAPLTEAGDLGVLRRAMVRPSARVTDTSATLPPSRIRAA